MNENDLKQALVAADLARVRETMIAHPEWIERADEAGVPLFLYAGRAGDLPLARYIVEYSRASLSTSDREGRNLLHYAAESGSVECCRYLIERGGMNPLAPDRELETPYRTARRLRHAALEAYFAGVVGAPLEEMYRNPVRRGMFPDPSVARVGDDYYMVNSSFTYFPCIPVSHSRDLVHWRIVGHAVTRPEWAGLNGLASGCGYWAPDISYCDRRFYICATYRLNDGGAVCRRQMVVTAERPEGPYSKPVFFEEDGIDPSLFHDDDGRHYMLLNRGARIFEVDASATGRLSETTLLYYGDCKKAPEGPHLLKKDGYYYLFLAEGGTGMGHRETVARARTLYGPYTPSPYNPLIRQRDEKALLQRCGHGKPVCTRHGEWFILYLCGRVLTGGYTLLGRETALDALTWTPDGWPLMNGGQGPSALAPLPTGLAPAPFADDGDPWMTPRAPLDGEAAYRDGRIRLRGSGFPLTDIRCRSVMVRRQTAFRFAFSAAWSPAALPEGGEAGLTCYYDERTHITFGLAWRGGRYFLRVTEQIGEARRPGPETELALRAEDALTLIAEGDGFSRTFACRVGGGERRPAGALTGVTYLADEGFPQGKRFTGATVGVYALYGADVVFSRLSYEEKEER